MNTLLRMALVSVLLTATALPAYAAGRLKLYCSTDIAWCELMTKEFEKRTGIKVEIGRAHV